MNIKKKQIVPIKYKQMPKKYRNISFIILKELLTVNFHSNFDISHHCQKQPQNV